MKLQFATRCTLGSALVLALSVMACSPQNKARPSENGGKLGGQGGSNAGGASSSNDTGNNAGGSAGGDLGFGGSDQGTGTGSGFQECAKAKQAPSTLPLNIFVAVDKSGSMTENNKWNNVKAAFNDFFGSPENQASKISVALRFWPDGDCNTDTCNINACSVPQVSLGPLSDPGQVQSLQKLFNSKTPAGSTPMFPALAGAAKWGIDNAAMGEGATATVIVFVTDGEPHGCDEDINHIAKNAANAYSAAKVQTFAVGLAGSNESDMAAIATAGNTGKPFLIGNGNAQADLAAALKEIQKTTLACVFAMPEAESGVIDPTLVNLTYAPGGGMSETVGQVKGKADCANAKDGQGWYYDDPAKPHVIQLCPTLCDEVQKDDKGEINVVLGCSTQPA